MPADKRRKIVVARMFPDQKAKLDALCVYYTNATGKLTSGSEVINLLIERAYDERAKSGDIHTDKAPKKKNGARRAKRAISAER